MALKPPTAGLRTVRNNSIQPAKVQVVVAPGDELTVSDDLAEQLVGARVGIVDPSAPVKAQAPPAEPDEPEKAPTAKKAAKKATA